MNSTRPELASPKAQVAATASTTAGKLLIFGALGVLLYVAHAAFIPVALAFFFALVLSGPVEALHTMAIVKQKTGSIAKFTNRIDELRKPIKRGNFPGRAVT